MENFWAKKMDSELGEMKDFSMFFFDIESVTY
jgi:hypothetical protein